MTVCRKKHVNRGYPFELGGQYTYLGWIY